MYMLIQEFPQCSCRRSLALRLVCWGRSYKIFFGTYNKKIIFKGTGPPDIPPWSAHAVDQLHQLHVWWYTCTQHNPLDLWITSQARFDLNFNLITNKGHVWLHMYIEIKFKMGMAPVSWTIKGVNGRWIKRNFDVG